MSETATQFIDPAIINSNTTEDFLSNLLPDFLTTLNSDAKTLPNIWGSEVHQPDHEFWRIFTPPAEATVNSFQDVPLDWSMIDLDTKALPPDINGDSSIDPFGNALIDDLGLLTPPKSAPPEEAIGSFVNEPLFDNDLVQDIPSLPFDGSANISQSSLPGVPPSVQPQPTSSTEPVRKRRGRKRKVLSAEAQRLKRESFLERNRLAAGRCRQKKRELNDGLQEKKVQLEQMNKILKSEKNELLRELEVAMEMLRECGNCSKEPSVQSALERFATAAWESEASACINCAPMAGVTGDEFWDEESSRQASIDSTLSL